MSQDQNIDLVNVILQRIPEFRPLYDAHVQFYDGILPHVFFWDLARFLVEESQSNLTSSSSPGGRLLAILEEYFASGNDDVRDLIGTSFLENLIEYPDVLSSLNDAFGPNLKKQLDDFLQADV